MINRSNASKSFGKTAVPLLLLLSSTILRPHHELPRYLRVRVVLSFPVILRFRRTHSLLGALEVWLAQVNLRFPQRTHLRSKTRVTFLRLSRLSMKKEMISSGVVARQASHRAIQTLVSQDPVLSSQKRSRPAYELRRQGKQLESLDHHSACLPKRRESRTCQMQTRL
jgi:hypothetical protein